MFHTVYKTTNIINGKFYIGKHQTKDLNDGYLGSGKRLKYAIAKYGIDNFHKEILYICSNEKQMNTIEKILVVPDLETNYNLTKGGYGSFFYANNSFWTREKRLVHNKKVSPFGTKEFIEKQQALGTFVKAGRAPKDRSYRHNKEMLEQIAKSNTGKKRSEETKQKMRLAAMGNQNRRKKF